MKLKNQFPLVGLFLLSFLIHFNQVSAATKFSTFVAPVIDGVEDASWSTIAWDSVTHMVTNYKNPFDINDLSCRFKLAWDKDALYIIAHVTDDKVLNPSDPTQIGHWNNDYFEMYLDLNNTKLLTPSDKDYTWNPYDYGDNQLRVTMGYNIDPDIAGGKSIIDSICSGRSKGYTGSANYLKSLQKVNGVKIRRVLDPPVAVDGEMLSQGYTIEEKIPWAAMNNPLAGVPTFVPAANTTIGFDINIGDNDGMGRDREMAWKSYSDYMFQNPGFWGNMIFQADGSFASDNDNVAPSPVTGLTLTTVGTEGTLNWNASTDDRAYVFYKIYDTYSQSWSVFLGQTEATSYKLTTPLVKGKVVKFMVKAYDKASNESVAASIEIKTAIKDISESNIKIYPNPVKGILTLTNANLVSSIQIMNIQGQILLTNSAKPNSSIDVSALKSGTYFVKIKSTNGEQYISKIVKE